MKARIVQIGNSQGIRIPKSLLEQSGLNDVELEVKDQQIIIRTARKPRENWESKFRAMTENAEDHLLDKEALPHQSKWDKNEWTW